MATVRSNQVYLADNSINITKTTNTALPIVVYINNKSQTVTQYAYEISGYYSNHLQIVSYFSLTNNLDLQNYQSYTISLWFNIQNVNIFNYKYYIVSLLTFDQQKIAGPVLSSINLPTTQDSGINISLLFPSYLTQANKIFKIELYCIPSPPIASFGYPLTTLLAASSQLSSQADSAIWSNSVKPFIYSTLQSTNIQTPSITNSLQSSNFPVFQVLARYQFQSGYNDSSSYTSVSKNVNYTTNTKFPFMQYTSWFEAGIVFTTQTFLMNNGSSERFFLNITNLPASVTTPSSIPYICTMLCIINKAVILSPVLYLTANYSKDHACYILSNIDLTDIFPNIMSSPSLKIFIRIQGCIDASINKTTNFPDIPQTLFSEWQYTNGNSTTATILGNIPITKYYDTAFGGLSNSMYSYIPLNGKSITTGYAQLPTLSIGSQNDISSYIHIYNSLQYSNLNVYPSNFTIMSSLYIPSSVNAQIDFELLAPLNDLQDSNDLIITLNGLSFAGLGNMFYMISAELYSDGASIAVSENFFHLFGSSGQHALSYVLFSSAETGVSPSSNWLTKPLSDNNFMLVNENVPFTYQFGPYPVTNLLLLPFPNFDATSDFVLDVNGNTPTCCVWTGYLDVHDNQFWFSMASKKVDDLMVVQVLDAVTNALLFTWQFPIGNPVQFFWLFTTSGLYPIIITYQNSGGPLVIDNLTMGFWGDDSSKFRVLWAPLNPLNEGDTNFNFNPTFPGVSPGMNTLTNLNKTVVSKNVQGSTNQNISYQSYLYDNTQIVSSNNNYYQFSFSTPNQQWQSLPDSFRTSAVSFNLSNLFSGHPFIPGKKYSVRLSMTRVSS